MITKRFLWISLYALAMALLEAVVVAYLRGLHSGPTVEIGRVGYGTMELWREVATIVMLVAVGWLAGRHWLDRLAYGLFTFGLWDIGYYLWLKLFLDWPQTLFDWDVLFLIPLRWWGPVLSPVLIALLICLNAVLAVVRFERGIPLHFTVTRVGLVTAGVLLALVVFMLDTLQALLTGRSDWDSLHPETFQWPLFLVALTLMALPSLLTTWPGASNDR